MRSTPSLRSFPNVAFETVPMFVWLTMALSRPFKEVHLGLPLLSSCKTGARVILEPHLFQQLFQSPYKTEARVISEPHLRRKINPESTQSWTHKAHYWSNFTGFRYLHAFFTNTVVLLSLLSTLTRHPTLLIFCIYTAHPDLSALRGQGGGGGGGRRVSNRGASRH